MRLHLGRARVVTNRLNASVLASFVILVVGARSSLCQKPEKSRFHGPPLLSIKVIPDKTTYALHEKLTAKYELTNLSDETLCFPPPEGCDFSTSGSLPNSDGTGGFGAGMGCGSERSIPRDVLADVEQRWIKLPPNQTYLTAEFSGIEFIGLGRWSVQSTFRSPKLSGEERDALKSMACKMPERTVSSESVLIEVVEKRSGK